MRIRRYLASVRVPLVVCRAASDSGLWKPALGSDTLMVRLALRGILCEPTNWIRSWMPLMSPMWRCLRICEQSRK
jgi:hypothetical protein